MNKINTDGNLAALRKYQREQDAADRYEMRRESCQSEAFDNMAFDLDYLTEVFGEMDDSILEIVAAALSAENDNRKVDYMEIGRLLVNRMTDYIAEPNRLDDEIDAIIRFENERWEA